MLNISPQLQAYILEHSADDPDRIRLAGKDVHGYSAGFVADQIEARQRYRRRFPTWCADPLTIFPPKINLEQSSSEATAAEKAEFMVGQTGKVKRIIDLSAGFGVDALSMASIAEHMTLVEPDATLREITESNFIRLVPGKAEFSSLPAEEYVRTCSDSFDWIYLDPSRRKSGNKVYRLEDTSPDPVALASDMFRIAGHILIKTSPMLDIAAVTKQWDRIKTILIISVSNECREVLYHLTPEKEIHPKLICINRSSETRETFSFNRSEEESSVIQFADPLKYIFEPNASVLKAGAFKLIAERFGLAKLAPHTHLYTSDHSVSDFPGKTFEVMRTIGKSDQGLKANIISRNHPMTTAQIAQKFQVRDGGDDFIIACSGRQHRFLLLTRRT